MLEFFVTIKNNTSVEIFVTFQKKGAKGVPEPGPFWLPTLLMCRFL